jgi:hypothetical protein
MGAAIVKERDGKDVFCNPRQPGSTSGWRRKLARKVIEALGYAKRERREMRSFDLIPPNFRRGLGVCRSGERDSVTSPAWPSRWA